MSRSWAWRRATIPARSRALIDCGSLLACRMSGRPVSIAQVGVRLVAQSRVRSSLAWPRFRQVLGQAVDDERIARNPCRIDGGGIEHHPEQRTVTIGQLDGLADAVDGRYRALVLCAGLGGIREGELFALRRSDVDLEGGLIRVRRKRLRLASGQVIEGQPKSRAGVRDVVLPVQAVDELREHLERWARPRPDDYVFTSPEGMPLERNNFRMRAWLPATAMLGLEGLKFHELRHTAGTLAEISDVALSATLGTVRNPQRPGALRPLGDREMSAVR